MRIEQCDTLEKFKQFLRELNGEIDDVLFQNIVATALKFDLNPDIFGGGGGDGPFGNGGGSSVSGTNTTARRYARGISAPSRVLYPHFVGEIKQAFAD